MDEIAFLQQTVESTSRRLDNITVRVEHWERALSEANLAQNDEARNEQFEQFVVDNYGILNILRELAQVREEYEQLRVNIIEIQQIQRELTHRLRTQLNQVHARYGFLRRKIGPSLPRGMLMNTNANQPSPEKRGPGVRMPPPS